MDSNFGALVQLCDLSSKLCPLFTDALPAGPVTQGFGFGVAHRQVLLLFLLRLCSQLHERRCLIILEPRCIRGSRVRTLRPLVSTRLHHCLPRHSLRRDQAPTPNSLLRRSIIGAGLDRPNLARPVARPHAQPHG